MTTRQHSETAVSVPPRSAGQVRARGMRGAEPKSVRAKAAARPFAENLLDQIDPELRHRMISEAAYQMYEERGFADGYDLDDWLQAESEVERQLFEQR